MSIFGHYGCYVTFLVFVTSVTSDISRHLIFGDRDIVEHKIWEKRMRIIRDTVQQILMVEDDSEKMSGVSKMTEFRVIFQEFTTLLERKYEIHENEKRFLIFMKAIHRQFLMNKREAALNGSAVYGVNQFSDWSPEEFRQLLNVQGKIENVTSRATPVSLLKDKSAVHRFHNQSTVDCTYQNLPYRQVVDWRSKVSRVKDQGKCGSCWAFVSSEQVESYWAIKGNPVVELSPQELLSCSESLGCDGGNTCAALTWLRDADKVLLTEQEYPYEGVESKCKHESVIREGPKVKAVCGCHSLVGKEEIMLKLVDQKGPLSVNVDAVLWHDYVGGVIQHHCTNQYMNHAVQIVGYNLLDENIPYWLAKNEWGQSFGENGYIRIKYGQNLCGVAQQPAFIVV